MFVSKIIKQAAACVTALIGSLTSFTACEDDTSTYYGPPPVTPEDAQECCKNLSDLEAIQCINDYYANGYCQNNAGTILPNSPKVTLEECCGQLAGRAYETCAETYKANNQCGNSTTPSPTIPKPSTPEIIPEDAANCCKSLQGNSHTECIQTYKNTGVCPVAPDRSF